MSERGPVDVGALADFAEGAIARVEVDRRAIGVLRWQGRVYAFADRCPHMGAPICRGRVVSRLDASGPGLLTSSREQPVLACPWHGWEFVLDSGRALVDDKQRLRTYGAEVENGRVVVDPTRHGAGAATS